MKKKILLLIFAVSFFSCNQLSEEERLIHNQKVISGIDRKKSDLDKILANIDEQSKKLSTEFDDVYSFKIGRSSSTKRAQIAELEKKSRIIYNYRLDINNLKNKLDVLHKTFEWQESPKKVLEKLFEIAKYGNYNQTIFLVDPYDENDNKVDKIAYISAYPVEEKDEFMQNFKYGRIIGTPIIKEKKAEIEFLFGLNADYKRTMKLVKRNKSWYLSSY